MYLSGFRVSVCKRQGPVISELSAQRRMLEKSLGFSGSPTQLAPKRTELSSLLSLSQQGRHINNKRNCLLSQGRQHALKRRSPPPTLHPNINDKVLLVQATLQWQIIGVKQSGSLTTGDIPSGLRQWQLARGPAPGACPAHGAAA
jgi:hypothetical protein